MSAGRRGDLGISHLSFVNHRTIMVRLSLYVEHRNRSGCAGIDDDQAVAGNRPDRGSKGRGPPPGAGEVTIDVAYAGINFMDVMARRGDPGYASAWPYTPGLEVSGTVREVGPGFTTLAVGQPVVAYTPGGGLAEVARTRAEFAVPVPDRVGLPGAAAAPLMLTTAMLL